MIFCISKKEKARVFPKVKLGEAIIYCLNQGIKLILYKHTFH